jgi:uncharacterized membrane protein
MARVSRRAVSVSEPASALATSAAVRLGLAEHREEAENVVRRLTLAETVAELAPHGFAPVAPHRYAMYYRHRARAGGPAAVPPPAALARHVALWPMNAFFWEYRFDLVPTALLALGLLLAARGRWGLSGAALGLGAAIKWIPGLSFAYLAIWLLASRRPRELGTHAGAFIAVFVGLHVPFLLWSFEEATYTYRYFSGQGITGESVWYPLLGPLGLATVNEREFWLPADVPAWADPLVVAVQAVLLLGLTAAAARARGRLHPALAIAAMAPVIFLLTNRIFSPQYLVPILACWAIAGAVLLESRRMQLALGIAAMAATTANAFVYPYTLHQLSLWKAASAVLFAVALVTTALVVWRVFDAEAPKRSGHLPPPRRPLRAEAD